MSESVLGLVKVKDKEYLSVLNSLKKHYRIDADYGISFHSPYHRLFTNYNWRHRWGFNNRWRLTSIHKKTHRIDAIGYMARARIWDRVKRRPTWRNVFIKECPSIPIEFAHHYHDIRNMGIDTPHPMMEEAVRYLHSPEAMTNMEVFVTYALSRLTETGLAPTYPLFYGAWRTTLREWTKDMTDCDELEEIEDYIEQEKNKDDDDGSFDIDKYKREPLKTCYRLFEYNDGDIWCSVNNFPVYLLATEKMEADLYNLAKESPLTNGEIHSMWWQVVYGIMVYQGLGITHNDLHVSNVMFKTTDKRWLYYRLGDRIIEVPTFGRLWKIIDYGRATYEGEGLSIGTNMAFGATGECYNVLFSPRLNGLGRRPNKPHAGVDTMTLAMNILMDVFGSPNCVLSESARAYFENIISDSDGNRVCYLDKEITFEDHIRIVNAKPLEKTIPENILNEMSKMYREVRLEELDDGETVWGSCPPPDRAVHRPYGASSSAYGALGNTT